MVLFDMSWFPAWYHHNLSHQILGVVLCTSVHVLEFRYHMKLNIASSPSIHSIHRQLCKKFDKTTINPESPSWKLKLSTETDVGFQILEGKVLLFRWRTDHTLTWTNSLATFPCFIRWSLTTLASVSRCWFCTSSRAFLESNSTCPGTDSPVRPAAPLTVH